MSSRCNVIIKKGSRYIQIYRHHDGYPEGQHGIIATLPHIDANTPSAYGRELVRHWRKIALVEYQGKTKKWEGVHMDAEHVYMIDLLKQTIEVYSYNMPVIRSLSAYAAPNVHLMHTIPLHRISDGVCFI